LATGARWLGLDLLLNHIERPKPTQATLSPAAWLNVRAPIRIPGFGAR
jgi:hypothetical protein